MKTFFEIVLLKMEHHFQYTWAGYRQAIRQRDHEHICNHFFISGRVHRGQKIISMMIFTPFNFFL
ncbi:hypothetical protein HA44_10955 [Mixta gaviniae]|nr:hypothetical protein HA44_10955 [Mixta gaviniae]